MPTLRAEVLIMPRGIIKNFTLQDRPKGGIVISPHVVRITSAEGRPVKEKVSRHKTSGSSIPHRPARHYHTQRRQPIFQGESKGGLRGRAAFLEGSSRSEVPTAIPLWRFPKAEPLAAGVKGAFRNAPLPRAGGCPQKKKGILFYKILSGCGVSTRFIYALN